PDAGGLLAQRCRSGSGRSRTVTGPYLQGLTVTGFFFFSSRRRHTRFSRDWSSDVCSSDLLDPGRLDFRVLVEGVQRLVAAVTRLDRKSTRLNSSHVKISYAVFCLKKKTNNYKDI